MSSEQGSWSNIVFRCAVATGAHPIDLTKTLIQLGHEPLAPVPTRTFFGRPALGLPNVFQYIGYIKKRDGFFGLYRGLGPKMCATIIKGMAFQKATELFIVHVEGKKEKKRDPFTADDEEEEEEVAADETFSTFALTLARNITATTASIIASQPFHVIAVRTMAQFVGEEQKYTGVFASAKEIYHESGIAGFFQGVTPRIIGELLALVLASSASFTVSTYILGDPRYRATLKTTFGFLSTSLTYPFHVVSACMAVNNSGLAAGQPPHMPIYVNWTDCWSHLSRNNQLKRGSSIVWRYYTGTTAVLRPN
ncbi:hypothetical protein DAPPUDRAFT_201699 [Daphnia pulex]|uniref:Mitochondrial carrier protein n=1 Tax=Daphnia pulex TaxID=6669 RepID=E9H9M0_DAPPU|nr:hypothetical protein DAPPUDRAFT_201699 [Daphnia pulex]|eukprot:EFX71520.1 hypothetical protein DAPPUDRAFT_201699 [Daphnia pulex]